MVRTYGPNCRRSRGLALLGLAAALALSGCGGDESQPEPNGGSASAEVFQTLQKRPLDLPNADLSGELGGRCFGGAETDVGAIHIHGIPTEAVLGPGPGLGELEQGPVYSVLLAGPPRIVYLSTQPRIKGSSVRAVNTLWVSRPSYEGPVLIRGIRLDRRGRIGFGAANRPRPTLRLPAGSWPRYLEPQGRGNLDPPLRRLGEDWRVTAVATRVPAEGCYAFQVDGVGFSYVLTFGVQ
jgi:hypothetical protein